MKQDIKECYRLLEVNFDAGPAAVRESYLQLVKIWHPDRFVGDAKLQLKAQERLKEINLAYEAVVHHQRDALRRSSSNSAPPQPPRHPSSPNDAEEHYRTGLRYLGGKGTPTNYQEAARWFLKAAEQKNGPAMYQLGVLYAKGKCKPAGIRALRHIGLEFGDKVEAYKWLYLAIIYGVEEAIIYLDRNNDATPVTAARANEARMRAAYLFPEYRETTPQNLLGDLARTYLRLMRDGKAADGRGGQTLFAKLMDSFKELEEVVLPLADQTYAMARAEFGGLALSGTVARWKYLLGPNEPDDLVKKCAMNLVCHAAGRLPSNFAILRAQMLNHIWVKEIMPGLLVQTGTKA